MHSGSETYWVFNINYIGATTQQKIKLHDYLATREGLSKTYPIIYDLHPGFSHSRMLSKVVPGWYVAVFWICLESQSVKMGRFHKGTLIRENKHFGQENDKSAMNRNISSLSIYMCVP